MVFLAKFYLTCCFWHSWIVSRETIQQEDKKDYDRRKPYFGFQKCWIMLHLWGCNLVFYAKLAVLLLERFFCRFLFHVKQKSIICALCGRNGLNRWNRKLCKTIGTRDGRRYLKAGCKKICVLCTSALTAYSISVRSLCFCALNCRWKAREFILKRKRLLLWLRIGRFARLFHVKQSCKSAF